MDCAHKQDREPHIAARESPKQTTLLLELQRGASWRRSLSLIQKFLKDCRQKGNSSRMKRKGELLQIWEDILISSSWKKVKPWNSEVRRRVQGGTLVHQKDSSLFCAPPTGLTDVLSRLSDLGAMINYCRRRWSAHSFVSIFWQRLRSQSDLGQMNKKTCYLSKGLIEKRSFCTTAV